MERATDIGPPRKRSDLSRVMQSAYEYARLNGGTLTRFPGGLHQPVQWMRADRGGGLFFGTSTIEGLVRRGYATYSKWQEGRRGKFPIEVTMLMPERATEKP